MVKREEEIWKEIIFNFQHINPLRVEVSQIGRVRTFSDERNKRLVQGSMINGYKVLKLKFFTKRNESTEAKLGILKSGFMALEQELRQLKREIKATEKSGTQSLELQQKLASVFLQYQDQKKKYRVAYRKDELKRTINHSILFHRLVAENFVSQPSPEHKIVAHLDFDKLNNHHLNLRWMTMDEHVAHQHKSPYVQAAREKRKGQRSENSKVNKLTSTQVMLIKKKILQGVKLKNLAKTFKVTETQILRIKRGENWGNIEAAN